MYLFIVSSFIALTQMTARADEPPSAPAPFEPEFEKQACLSEEQVKEWTQGLGIKIVEPGLDLCSPTTELKKIYDTLRILKEGKFDSAPVASLERGIVPESYWDYFNKRVDAIQRSTFNRPWTGAYLEYFIGAGHGVLYVESLFKPHYGSTAADSVAVFVHEARHADEFPHVDCIAGFKKGDAEGCDKDYAAGGSYGAQLEYLARVATRGANFHPVFKTMARLSAVRGAMNDFQVPPMQNRTGLALVEKTTGNLQIFDGKTLTTRAQVKTGAKLAPLFTGVTMAVIPADRTQKSWPIDLYGASQPEELLGNPARIEKLFSMTLTDYNENWSLGQRKYFVDFVESSDADGEFRLAYLYGGGLSTMSAQNQNELSFAAGMKPSRFLSVSPGGETGLYVLFQSGQIQDVTDLWGEAQPPTTAMLTEKLATDLISIAPWDASVVALEKTGRLVLLAPDGTRQEFAPLAGKTFDDLVSVSLWDGLDVVPQE